MRKLFSQITLALLPLLGAAQFHTVKRPQASPKVTEIQQLGVTDISVDYGSPAVKGRNVWTDVVGSYGDPNLVWRAGANMNTRIAFSTDVTINGNPLKAGSYGFHIDTSNDDKYILIFAHHDNQWGSYYLDRDKHVALELDVTPQENVFTEQLDYRFIERTDSTVVVALDWDEKRIPFTVAVDLNKTVVENFRYELLGVNTYRWEAWDDAANWCYNRNTNLEEALAWANRSINGGYTGFAANKNFRNMSTKAKIQLALGQESEAQKTVTEMQDLMTDMGDAYFFGDFLLKNEQASAALDLFESGFSKFGKDNWVMTLGYGRALHASGNTKGGKKSIEKALSLAPDRNKGFVESVLNAL